jgi:hypothetical protein
VRELELNMDLRSVNNLLEFLEKVFNGGSGEQRLAVGAGSRCAGYTGPPGWPRRRCLPLLEGLAARDSLCCGAVPATLEPALTLSTACRLQRPGAKVLGPSA